MKFPIIGAIFAGLVAAVGIDQFLTFVNSAGEFDNSIMFTIVNFFAGYAIGYGICLKIAPAKIRKTLVVIFALVLSLSDILQFVAEGGNPYMTDKEIWETWGSFVVGSIWIAGWVYGAVLPLITGTVIYFIFYKEKKTMSSKKQK